MMCNPDLFTPVRLGALAAPNRIVYGSTHANARWAGPGADIVDGGTDNGYIDYPALGPQFVPK